MTVLVGAGVEISNVEFNASIPFAGVIQAQAGYFDATGTTFPIPEGVLLATGNVSLAVGPNDSGGATDNDGVAPDPDDPDLDAIGTATINNEAVLEFDFIPSGDSVLFNFVFASEEYHEFSTSTFNDVFGFFISGPGFAGPFTDGAENIAIIPGTALPITMNNLNNGPTNTGPCMNCEFLVDNPTGSLDIQYDAHTVVLTARAEVECGETYHIKMAIGDAGDMSLDSGVFLEASSFSSNGVSVETASVLGEDALIEGCDSALVSFIRPEDSDTVDLTVDFEIGGTADNGVDYDLIDESVFFPEGEDTVQIYIVPTDDMITEGTETVTITVEIINECGDTILTTAEIEIIDPSDFDVITEDITLECPEDSVMVTFTTDGGVPEFDIDWSSGGTEMDEWVPGDIEGTTTYTVTVVDVCGVESTGTIDVTLDPADAATITFNEDLFIICPGEEIFIDATITDPYDPDAVTYDWDPTGETTEDITTTPDEEGWYYLSVFDGCNNVLDSTKIEFGNVDIDVDVIDAIDCPGVPGASLGSITVDPDDPTWTYELVGYGDPQDSGIFEDLAGGIDYILIVTDENGCTKDTVITVGLGDNAVIATWVEDSLRNVTCFGDADGGAFIHEIGGGITPPYDVTWTSPLGVFDTDLGLPVDGESEQDNLFGGTWVVTVTDQEGCAWSHTFEIFEPDVLELDIIFNNPSCFEFSDGSVTANTTGGNGGNIYEIRDADGNLLNIDNSNTANTLGEGTYSITVTDENGCTVSGSVDLTHPDQLDIELNINQPLCYGIPTGTVEVDSVFNATGDYDAVSYFWTPNPGGSNGIGATFINHLEAGDYVLTVNDENGCTNTFDFTIEYPDSLYFAELGFDPAHCRLFNYQNGNGVVFAAAAGGTGDFDYQWTYLEDGTTTTNSTWGGRNPGCYEIRVRDDNNCLLLDTVCVDSVGPLASFNVISDDLNSDCKGTADVEVEFENTSQYFSNDNDPGADTTFLWTLNEGTAAYSITHDFLYRPDTMYTAQGATYTVDVCLIALNSNGCADTTCKELTIFEPIIFPVVNIFTPNNDGTNDFFTFSQYAASISEFHCVIVNRWGVQVGEINDISGGWDGTDMNGDPCPDGVYFYSYEWTADDGTQDAGQGNCHIVTGQ